MRGETLVFWASEDPIDAEADAAWNRAAQRIVNGLVELGHLTSFIEPERRLVGFCAQAPAEAVRFAGFIADENVESHVVCGRPDGIGPIDDVVLPCSPAATDEEIRHVVLAAVKAAHAVRMSPQRASVERLIRQAGRRLRSLLP